MVGLRPRRWIIAVAVAAVPIVLVLGLGHRGVHAARSMILPGAGLIETSPLLAAGFLALAVIATVGWLRWGVDWAVVVVVAVSMVASAVFAVTNHSGQAGQAAQAVQTQVARASHEFPLVVLFAGMIGWLRSVLGRVPGFGWIAGRRPQPDEERALADLHPTDRCRAVALAALANSVDDEARAAVRAADVARRARRVGLLARVRRGGDPFRVDHAHTRAALALVGDLDAEAARRFVEDARRSPVGVPASEPTWVRTLDATLAAAALDELGESSAGGRWAAALDGPLRLRRGHRPAWWWSPLGVAAGRCLDWEHAAATAIAHSRGWIGSEDWPALRQRVLGAAARGSGRRDDERLIAAGRVWLAQVDDAAASRVLDTPKCAPRSAGRRPRPPRPTSRRSSSRPACWRDRMTTLTHDHRPQSGATPIPLLPERPLRAWPGHDQAAAANRAGAVARRVGRSQAAARRRADGGGGGDVADHPGRWSPLHGRAVISMFVNCAQAWVRLMRCYHRVTGRPQVSFDLPARVPPPTGASR